MAKTIHTWAAEFVNTLRSDWRNIFNHQLLVYRWFIFSVLDIKVLVLKYHHQVKFPFSLVFQLDIFFWCILVWLLKMGVDCAFLSVFSLSQYVDLQFKLTLFNFHCRKVCAPGCGVLWIREEKEGRSSWAKSWRSGKGYPTITGVDAP